MVHCVLLKSHLMQHLKHLRFFRICFWKVGVKIVLLIYRVAQNKYPTRQYIISLQPVV